MLSLLEVASPGATDSAINFGPIILGIVAVLGLLGALKGFTRGVSRQLIRTITVVVSVVISFFLAKGIYTSISSFLSDKTMDDIEQLLINYNILSAEADNSWIQNIDINTIMLVATVPLALVVMPLAFVIAFILISGIMLIVHTILCAIFGFRKRGNSLPSRFIGMALGLAQGVLVAGLLLMPVIGISSTVSESAEVIRQESAPDDESSAQLVSIYDDYIKSIAENPAAKALGACGVNELYKSIATVEIENEKTDMTTLIPDIAIVSGKITALRGVDFTSLTPENERTITELFDAVEKNAYLTRVLAGGIKMFSYTYTNGVIGVDAPPAISSLLDSAMAIFHTTDSTNVHKDIDTLCEVIFTLSRDGVLTSFESGSSDMMSALTKRDESGTTTVKKVIGIINKNERTKPLIKMLTDLSVSVMRDAAGVDENTLATGERLKSGINEKAMKINRADYESEDAYVAAVSTSLDETLKQNEITLEKGVVDNMAKYIAENYGDKDEISDEEANDIILYYLDAHLDYTEGKAQN